MTLGLLSALGVTGGCSSPPKLQPKGEVVAAMPADGKRPKVTCKVLNELVVKLPPLTTSGTEWMIILNDTRFLQPWKPITPTPDGGATASFVALRQGRRAIRFFALPPQSREVAPAQAYELQVMIE
jgi:hypothetical protein